MTNGMSLHPKRYCIFALVHSVSKVIIYFSEVYDSGWNITPRFGSRFRSIISFLFLLLTYV